MLNRQVSSRWDNIEVVAVDWHSVCRLEHGHRRMTREQVHHHAFVCGVEMLNQDKSHAAVGGQRIQEAPAGVEPPCRRTNSYNWKVIGVSRGTAGQRNPSV